MFNILQLLLQNKTDLILPWITDYNLAFTEYYKTSTIVKSHWWLHAWFNGLINAPIEAHIIVSVPPWQMCKFFKYLSATPHNGRSTCQQSRCLKRAVVVPNLIYFPCPTCGIYSTSDQCESFAKVWISCSRSRNKIWWLNFVKLWNMWIWPFKHIYYLSAVFIVITSTCYHYMLAAIGLEVRVSIHWTCCPRNFKLLCSDRNAWHLPVVVRTFKDDF